MAQAAADHLDSLVNFLSDPLVSSLFASHPNDLGTASFQPPDEWDSWWSWAGGGTHCEEDSDGGELWTRLIQYYDFCRSSDTSASATMMDEIERLPVPFQGIPPSLRSLIGTASHLAVKREPGHVIYPPSSDDMSQLHVRQKDRPGDGLHSVSANALRGMSPKKAHEVVQMSSFIGELLGNCSALSDVDHVVDVGAGQGYLSRALRDELGLHVLALDYSDIQTQGAAKRDAAPTKQKRRAAPGGSEESTSISRQTGHHADTERSQDGNEEVKTQRGSLTYVTAKIDADTLRQSTRAWVESDGTVVDRRPSEEQTGHSPKPVLFVALHACGSLTPDLLRAFAAQRKVDSFEACWTPRAAVVVGCCYNMLRPEDFPLSHALRSRVALNPNHLQLAAQVPAQWVRSEDTLRDARLALRKVVWRALIQDVLQPPHPNPSSGDPGSGSAEAAGKQRLGRLNDSAYADWETFADRVRTRLGMREGSLVRADRATERRIEVFHTLRCIVGPVIESLIMLDRAVWLEEELQGTGFRVELVNLFDQASGSGRNVAVVILPDDRTRW